MRSLALAEIAFLVGCGGRAPEAAEEWMIPAREGALARRGLTPDEAAVLDRDGFAILGGGEVDSFHAGYSALFHAHQPVYVTADSLLYAWHASYDAILSEVERTHLAPTMIAMLGRLRQRLALASGADPQARADLDAYLAVAHGLATGEPSAPVAGGDPALVAQAFERAQRGAGTRLTLFGAERMFDFSMLTPRGHYTLWPELGRYFRAVSWLGRVEIRIASRRGREPWQIDRRALRAAALLGSLFDGEARAEWQMIDAALSGFVGPPDSMSLPGLFEGLRELHGESDAAGDAEVVAAFERRSAQRIRTQLAHGGEQSIAFVALAQRFTPDSLVLSDLTHGALATRPPRLMPTPLDIGYAVFQNPAARRLLDPEVSRYGPLYAQALEAARRRAGAGGPAAPEASLHRIWLGALAQLSPDRARDASLPAPLATDAWGRRMLAAQLASWAELRHDNFLYAKQSFTAVISCAYPDGYVDPYPGFYTAMGSLARRGRAAIERLGLPSRPERARLVAYFDQMGRTMARLRSIADRERADRPLSEDDLDFLNHMVALEASKFGCGAPSAQPTGWYADLYYDRSKIMEHEPIVADVHTQPTDENGAWVGRVLHVGTGKPRGLVVRLAHDRGRHAQTYRGLVSSYGETITRDFERLTDQKWRFRIFKQGTPTPDWLGALIAR